MMWQGLSLWMTLRHQPTSWIPSTYMPTQAGRLFYLSELAGPLVILAAAMLRLARRR